MTKGLILDGIAASSAVDSSGEILDIAGVDLTDFEEGRAELNWEHKSGDKANPSDIIGKVVFCKKIFKEEDCGDERQLMYWKQVQLPYIYVICRLYDAAGHPEAIAAAAQIRDHVANNEPINIRFSIEGNTLEREGPFLKKTIAKALAATMRPCNKSCDSGMLDDPMAPESFKNKNGDLKKYLHTSEWKYVPFFPATLATEEIKKAISAGGMDAPPSSLQDGSSLQKEDLMPGGKGDNLPDSDFDPEMLALGIKIEMEEHGLDEARAKEVAKDHLVEDPDYYKKELEKADLNPVSEEFLDKYAELTGDVKIGRTKAIRKFENWTIELKRLAKIL